MNRNAILALIVVAAAGVGGWMFYGQRQMVPPREPAPDSGTPSVPQGKADLMTPSPLGENVEGKDDAPITVIEYASLTCPHCANFYLKFYPELKKKYVDTGKVRFIFREFPRDDVDLYAYMLTRCVSGGSKDKYFAFVGALFERQDTWVVRQPLPPLRAIAKQAGMTDEGMESCAKDKKVQEAVEWVGENGAKLGVDSTPTFFINGNKHTGSFEQLDKAIAALVKE